MHFQSIMHRRQNESYKTSLLDTSNIFHLRQSLNANVSITVLTTTEALGRVVLCSDGRHVSCVLVTDITTHSTPPTDTL